MRKLSEVEEAKRLMAEAMDWSVFKWLWEKRRVRETADRANAALDELQRKTKSKWPDDLKAAYKNLHGEKGGARNKGREQADLNQVVAGDGDLTEIVSRVKQADDKARRARMDAENTFDEAEKVLSTDLAREGCQKAIDSWILYEKAIRLAESAVGKNRDQEPPTKTE